jgi:hypothetical protein
MNDAGGGAPPGPCDCTGPQDCYEYCLGRGYGDVLTGLTLTPMGLRVSRKRSDVDLGREQAFAGVKQLRGECDVSLRTLR